MRRRLAHVALTLSSTFTIFLVLTSLGLMKGLFAEHGGDRAAGIFLVGLPFALCGCHWFWKRLGGRVAPPTKLLVMTPLVGLVLSFTVGGEIWSYCTGAWLMFLVWQYLKHWRLHGTWRALVIQSGTSA